jgi:UDP-N-acetylglucosamine 2-epimerase (non-hydrolysing)/GDP/UDP-N,N'-diacetylbacillosamine 2-epimerase (hydrolysing)
MRTTLRAIQAHPALELQLLVTGMHLDRAHGRSVDAIREEGWHVDTTVRWPRATTPDASAVSTSTGMSGIAKAIERLQPDVILVVGDRVEAFAAAAAGHVGGRVIAHVHGGDRALGQIDDSLRHAITKLSHLHFPATAASAERLIKLGEEHWRIRRVGSPGVDGICQATASSRELAAAFPELERQRFALLVLHPTGADESAEHRAAELVLRATISAGLPRIVIAHPNNDPGGRGIAQCWDAHAREERLIVRRDFARPLFLRLMRDAAVLVGNSSSGIIEAASFGTPVVDIGPRQAGRERSMNVTHVPAQAKAIRAALAAVWRNGRPLRFSAKNVYGGSGAGKRIAAELARLSVGQRLLRKLIAY